MESARPQEGMPAMSRGYWESLKRDLEAPIEARGFGTGWFAGFFAIVLAVAGSGLRWVRRQRVPGQQPGANAGLAPRGATGGGRRAHAADAIGAVCQDPGGTA